MMLTTSNLLRKTFTVLTTTTTTTAVTFTVPRVISATCFPHCHARTIVTTSSSSSSSSTTTTTTNIDIADNDSVRRREEAAVVAPSVFSGIQPSGVPHLGNYLGALRNWVKLQDDGNMPVMYSVVDLHAVTVPQDPSALRENILDSASALLACGVDPDRSVLFQQSRVVYHSELAWLLGCSAQTGELNRMTQWKAKAGSQRSRSCLGLYSYPVLMAADILLYRATHVPVGDDQKQHLELARMLAGTFNHTYKQEFFPKPTGLYTTAARVMSLRSPQDKMSKSDRSDAGRINLTDSPDLIRRKIRRAVTDSLGPVTYDEARPGVRNLVDMYAAVPTEGGEKSDFVARDNNNNSNSNSNSNSNNCNKNSAGIGASTSMTPQQVAEEFSGQDLGVFKQALAERLISHLAPVQDEFARLRADRGHVVKVLDDGAERARTVAETNMENVRRLIGLA